MLSKASLDAGLKRQSLTVRSLIRYSWNFHINLQYGKEGCLRNAAVTGTAVRAASVEINTFAWNVRKNTEAQYRMKGVTSLCPDLKPASGRIAHNSHRFGNTNMI